MTELPRVAAPSRFELGPLLEAKLTIPAPRNEFVSRSALIERARGAGRRIVAVTAPSGYGKSDLLSQWAAVENRAVAWVSLDRFDDDPVTLLTLLASAFVRSTGANSSLITEMRGRGVSALGRAAPRLAIALRASTQPFVLMLDDLHELNSPACHDILSIVVGGITHGSQLVTASRTEQPHVPRLRATGETLEIQADSLAMDAAGVQQIFAMEEVALSPALAEMVVDRTEGWPAGIYLAAVIARHTDAATTPVTGNDPYITDYLYRESLATLPEESQHFLRCTAVLDQFSADLCDALVGHFGSQNRLRELEASNVFIVPLDRRREWFRYHQLFREFLLGELRRVSPELISELHVRAADWYESNGSPAMAIEHLLETPERERCIKLVTELALPTYQNGQIETVHRWITALDDSAVHKHPPLGVMAGWIAVVAGQPTEADRWAAKVAQMSFDLEPFDGTASFNSSRAMLRSMMCAAGPEQALEDAQYALAEEPTWSPWRAQALCLAGEAHLALGDADKADAFFSEASEMAVVAGSHDVQVLSDSERAMIAMNRGRWIEGAKYVESALASIEKYGIEDYLTAVLALAGAARLALHGGDQKGAIGELTRAMRARPVCSYAAPALSVRIYLNLAKTHWAVGDHTTARHLLHEIDDILTHRPALGTLLDDVDSLRNIVSATAPDANAQSPLTPAELRLLPYLQTYLSFPDIGARLFVSRNTVSTEVGSIYRKLGVSSRSEAVERATAIGLLGG